MAKQTPLPGQSFGDHVAAWNANDTELYTLYDLLHVAVGDIDFGTFTGSTLSNNENAKTLFQQLETAFESLKGEVININQDFSIWQENTTFTNPATTVYTADGYYIDSAAGGGTLPTINVKKNTSVHEDAFVQSCELEITNVGVSDAGRYWRYIQNLEDCKKYRGKTVTLTIRVKASVAMTLPGGLWIHDGVGNGITAITSLTTSWQTFTATLIIDTGSTVLWSVFNPVAGAGEISTTGSIYIQYMKLELGSVATPLILRKTGEELALCQRYYQKSYLQTVFAGTATEVGKEFVGDTGAANADHTLYNKTNLIVPMKAAPTVALYDEAGTVAQVSMQNGHVAGVAANITEKGFIVNGTNGAGNVDHHMGYHYTAISRV